MAEILKRQEVADRLEEEGFGVCPYCGQARFQQEGDPRDYICVVGTIQTRSWVDQAGQKRFSVDVVAEEAHFVDALKDAPEALRMEQEEDVGDEIPEAVPKAKAPPKAFSTPGARKEFDKLDDEEELPF